MTTIESAATVEATNRDLSANAAPRAAAPRRPLIVRHLGREAYEPVWRRMQAFTDARNAETADELWLVEHEPVFTLGQAGKMEHVLFAGDIPVVPVDRGGQVTYHGPGQIVAYPLFDLRRLGIGVRELVHRIEEAGIRTMRRFGIEAARRVGAPGLYVGDRISAGTNATDQRAPAAAAAMTDRLAAGAAATDDTAATGAKIMALGLRVRRGCSFHGLALNANMDLEPFERINPCGYAGLRVTQVIDCGGPSELATVEAALVDELAQLFSLDAQKSPSA